MLTIKRKLILAFFLCLVLYCLSRSKDILMQYTYMVAARDGFIKAELVGISHSKDGVYAVPSFVSNCLFKMSIPMNYNGRGEVQKLRKDAALNVPRSITNG